MENRDENQQFNTLIEPNVNETAFQNSGENLDDNKNKLLVKGNDLEENLPADNKPKLKKCLFIELNPGFSFFNLFCYYSVQFGYVMAFTFIDACQDYLLESQDYEYKIAHEETGSVNGNILLFDTLYLILFIYIYGSFHDIFGRKIMIVYGFLSMALSLFLYPYAGNIYPNLILVRLIFSNGICAVTTQPLLADYVNHKSKGFGGGIASVVSGLGAIFAALFLIKLLNYYPIHIVYWITSGICVFIAFLCMFGIKNVITINQEKNVCNRFKDLFKKLKTGMKETCKNLNLSIGIVTSTLARMNTILITLFLVLWIKRDIHNEQESFKLGHMISGIGNSLGLVSAIIFGFLFEKRKISTLLLITNFFVFAGYGLFAFCDDPYDFKVNLSISIASFGLYGLLTIGYVLVNKNCGHKARGSVMGINCLFGAFGILFVAKIGGFLFDNVNKSAPFVVSGVLSFLLFCFLLIPKVRRSLDNPKVEQGCPIHH